MSANAAVLVPATAAAINAASTARTMVEVFIFWSSIVLNAPPKRRASSARGRTDAIGVKRRSGQGPRGLVGRWTGQTVANQVVRNQMRSSDRVAQREGGGLGEARLDRLQDAHRNQRAVLALLLIGATGHVGRHGHVAHAVRASLRGCRRRGQGRQRQTGGHQDRERNSEQPAQIHGPSIPRADLLWKSRPFTSSPPWTRSDIAQPAVAAPLHLALRHSAGVFNLAWPAHGGHISADEPFILHCAISPNGTAVWIVNSTTAGFCKTHGFPPVCRVNRSCAFPARGDRSFFAPFLGGRTPPAQRGRGSASVRSNQSLTPSAASHEGRDRLEEKAFTTPPAAAGQESRH